LTRAPADHQRGRVNFRKTAARLPMTDVSHLTEIERKRPYAGYVTRPMSPPPAEIYEALGKGPIDPADALPIGRLNDLLEPGYLATERGWCIMPDGTGFVAGLTTMPGVTADMIDWWFAWHGLEGLRYAIWNPDQHFDVHVAPADLERRLDKRLSLRERNWGTTDVVTEDVGTGTMLLDISFMSPEDFGYDMIRFTSGALTAVNANLGPHNPVSRLVCFTHQARAIAGGIELRSRFWIGWNMIDRKPVRVGHGIPAEVISGLAHALAHHCPKEYYNLAAILPQVYAENHDIPDDIAQFRH
jgi:phloretin hydrolase